MLRKSRIFPFWCVIPVYIGIYVGLGEEKGQLFSVIPEIND